MASAKSKYMIISNDTTSNKKSEELIELNKIIDRQIGKDINSIRKLLGKS